MGLCHIHDFGVNVISRIAQYTSAPRSFLHWSREQGWHKSSHHKQENGRPALHQPQHIIYKTFTKVKNICLGEKNPRTILSVPLWRSQGERSPDASRHYLNGDLSSFGNALLATRQHMARRYLPADWQWHKPFFQPQATTGHMAGGVFHVALSQKVCRACFQLQTITWPQGCLLVGWG